MRAARVAKTVRVGSLRLDVRTYADGRFGFDYQPPGEYRVKVRVKDLETAEGRAHEILGAARGGKVERLSIDSDEYAEFLRWKSERTRTASVPELVESFLAVKGKIGLSEKHLRDLGDLAKFAQRFPGPITNLTSREVTEWLDSRRVGPRRWNNILSFIRGLHNFARRERLLPAEKTPVELIERRRVAVEVHTYSVNQVESLLSAVNDNWLPVIVFGAFCGLRPEEVAPDPRTKKAGLRWENILWHKKTVDVPAKVAKDRRRRFAPLTEAAKAFLAPHRQSRGPVAPEGRMSNLIPQWTRRSGVKWVKDGLRHSFASYRLSLTKDMPALALEMGNSVAMIYRHYLDIKHEDEALRWFAIRPKSAKSVKPDRP